MCVCVCVCGVCGVCVVDYGTSGSQLCSELTERLKPLLIDTLTLHSLSSHTCVPELSVQPWDRHSSISNVHQNRIVPSGFNWLCICANLKIEQDRFGLFRGEINLFLIFEGARNVSF